MARSKPTTVRKSRKDQGPCGKCGTEIKRGDPYIWWRFRYPDRLMKRCDKPECRPTSADLESNSKRRSHILANAAFGEYTYGGNQNPDLLEQAISHVRDIVDELEESLSGLEGTNLASGQQYKDFSSTKEALEQWADDAQAALESAPECEGNVCQAIDFEEEVPDLDF
jgi:hypothetical protein